MSSRETKILVVDDDAAMREVLQLRLREWGYGVILACDGREGKKLAENGEPDIVISDVIMPYISGMELLGLLKSGNPARPVILVTAEASIPQAVEAMIQGAKNYIEKPIDYSRLRELLEEAEQEIDLRRESRRLAGSLEKGAGFGEFVGASRPMREVYNLISRVGASDASVMVTGESGTGKELVARTIHELSPRADGPFIAVNASAIPENLMESEIFGHERGAFTGATGVRAGCFELANRGTLFLDEIAEMPSALQPKLLRVLEDKRVRRVGGSREFRVDVRVLAATNLPPMEAVEKGKLRRDLFYRLNVFTLALPPLRERAEDIELLADVFLRQFNEKHGRSLESCSLETLELLKAHPWPGNVRELRNVMERAVILAEGPRIEPSHLPESVLNPGASGAGGTMKISGGVTAAEAEKELILRTLEATGNNKAEAARRLGLDVKTIRNKLKNYGIQ
ncbi:MAG: sigma-54-dependent Fis family transcriptional regulator [Acidobacteria bacterium]|nr:sigma-54-dependent Fis family transcriptional regulator [Acidobacteriota bacterium]